MPRLMKILAMVLIGLLIVPTASIILTKEVDYADETQLDFDPVFNDVNEPDPVTGTRSIQDNFVIDSTTPVMLPEEVTEWVQDDWIGGSGQETWLDPTKFKVSENLMYTEQTSVLKLGIGDTIEAWTELDSGPAARYKQNMVYSPSKEKYYIFGGLDESYKATNTLYEYDPDKDEWKQIGKNNPPKKRCSSVMVWDSTNNLIWLYGGSEYYNSYLLNDLWSYNPADDKWTKKANGPGDRNNAAGVYDPVNNQLIIYGGYIGDFYNPSPEVFVYNIENNEWVQKNPFSRRYSHSAVWSKHTNSMMVYGGIEKYDTSTGYTYTEVLSEYIPETDTWFNHSGIGPRRDPVLAYDEKSKSLILYGGLDPGYNNDTWKYNIGTDEWSETIYGPSPRDDCAGDYDTKNDQLLVFGGRWSNVMDELWKYNPHNPSYKAGGDLSSSVFDAGYPVNPRTVSYSLLNMEKLDTGEVSVKIQLAGSDKSIQEVKEFIGPNGKTWTYFSEAAGEEIPQSLEESRYFAYRVNLTTNNPLSTPELDWIKIEYATYKSSYVFESEVFDIGPIIGLPLREVNWNSQEPSQTGIEISFRQADTTTNLESLAWEKVENNQNNFGYKGGKYFQYRAELYSGVPHSTPVLDEINFIFNLHPNRPVMISPENNTWITDNLPEFNWTFSDPDEPDYQSGLEVIISTDTSFNKIVYDSTRVDSTENLFKIDISLLDGDYYWKVSVKDNYGSWSPWSDMGAFSIDNKIPTTPVIDCYSHPMESLWYSDNQPRFDWSEPFDITGIAGYSYLLDQSPDSIPPDTIMITNEEYKTKRNMKDFNGFLVQNDLIGNGIWYFHLKAVDSLGQWSDTASRTVKVDSEPPSIVDMTPPDVMPGADLEYSFLINDADSGVDLATISWRYATEVDFLYNELVHVGDGIYTLTERLFNTGDPYIEYYVTVTDRAEPANEISLPAMDYKRIYITDDEPPLISNSSGDFDQDPYKDLVVTVAAEDNVGISKAMIYFNGKTYGRGLDDNKDGTFSIRIDRTEIADLKKYHDSTEIPYYVVVWDGSDNIARMPEVGNYIITLKESDDDNTPPPDHKPVDPGMSDSTMITIMMNFLLVIVVAVVLIMFIRRNSNKITADRHKLRMAIADASEGVSSVTGAPEAGDPRYLNTSSGASFDNLNNFGAVSDSSLTLAPSVADVTPSLNSGPTPKLPGEVFPTGLLPPASETLHYSDYSGADEEHSGPPGPKPVPKPDRKNTPGGKPSVRIDDGVSVTLPASTPVATPVSSNVSHPIATSASKLKIGEEKVKQAAGNFWSPPTEKNYFEHKTETGKLDLTSAKKMK